MSETTLDLADYVNQTAQLLNLSIAPEYLPEVLKNITTIAAIASLITEFDLPEDLEAAPIFES